MWRLVLFVDLGVYFFGRIDFHDHDEWLNSMPRRCVVDLPNGLRYATRDKTKLTRWSLPNYTNLFSYTLIS